MCGIAGIFDYGSSSRAIDRDVLQRMNDSIAHRGPDGDGFHVEPGVGLAHRRLAIIDLSGGKQPLANEDDSVWITFNGEIYNYKPLMEELLARGHQFRTRCDTEVIVHAWEEWGEACVERFNGMFALAIWDRNRQTLFVARDRLGIKPLYYAELPGERIAFASELKALLEIPDLRREIDPRAVEEYFGYGYIPEPRSIFFDTHKLPPGHTLTLKRGAALSEPKRYWDVSFEAGETMSENEAGEELIRRLRDAVDLRLVSEVPLGAFLSGGVDSSAVVAMMAGLSDDPVKTCSIGFRDERYDETRYGKIVAERYATDHRTEQVDPDDFSLLERLAGFYDEPYADSSALPTYRVCELARREVTVALSGDGGDENLAGYRRYRWQAWEDRMRSFVPGGLRGGVFGGLAKYYPKADWAPSIFRAKSTFEALAVDAIEGYFWKVAIFGPKLRDRLFTPDFERTLDGYRAVEVLRRHAKQAPTRHPLSLVQYLDLKTYLVGDILTKVDRASMAHALEVRVPILDHTFVDWMSRLSPKLKLRGREGKYVFKKSLEPHLSNEILYRKKKGFEVPLTHWFRGPLKDRVRDSLLGDRLLSTGIFRREMLERLIDEHQSGRRVHSAPIWSLMMFEAFLERVMGERPVRIGG